MLIQPFKAISHLGLLMFSSPTSTVVAIYRGKFVFPSKTNKTTTNNGQKGYSLR